MLRVGTVLLALTIMAACSESVGPVIERQFVITTSASFSATLLDASGGQSVGAVVMLPGANESLQVSVWEQPGYQLRDVQVCALATTNRGNCQRWQRSTNSESGWHLFTLRADQMEPYVCTAQRRVFLRYRVLLNERLSSQPRSRRLSSMPNWLVTTFNCFY